MLANNSLNDHPCSTICANRPHVPSNANVAAAALNNLFLAMNKRSGLHHLSMFQCRATLVRVGLPSRRIKKKQITTTNKPACVSPQWSSVSLHPSGDGRQHVCAVTPCDTSLHLAAWAHAVVMPQNGVHDVFAVRRIEKKGAVNSLSPVPSRRDQDSHHTRVGCACDFLWRWRTSTTRSLNCTDGETVAPPTHEFKVLPSFLVKPVSALLPRKDQTSKSSPEDLWRSLPNPSHCQTLEQPLVGRMSFQSCEMTIFLCQTVRSS